jgi:hypothetical protein
MLTVRTAGSGTLERTRAAEAEIETAFARWSELGDRAV